jgi:hypothetical protein
VTFFVMCFGAGFISAPPPTMTLALSRKVKVSQYFSSEERMYELIGRCECFHRHNALTVIFLSS